MTDPRFPASEPGDPEDVVLALDTARVLFAGGEAQEAVRWIRKAADAAEQGGNDMRALALARAAADLTSSPPAAPTAPSSQAAPSTTGRSLPPPLRTSQAPRGAGPARPTQPPRSSAPRPATSVPSVAPSARRPQAQDAATPEPVETEPEPDTPAAASSPAASGTGPASLRPSPAAADKADKPTRQKRPVSKARDGSSPTAAKAAAKARGPRPSSNGGTDLANALQVSIKPSSRDERLFMMRMLKPGEQPPPGYRPALVVMVDSDEDESR